MCYNGSRMKEGKDLEELKKTWDCITLIYDIGAWDVNLERYATKEHFYLGKESGLTYESMSEAISQALKLSKEWVKLFIVRLYDGFDHMWMDVSKPVSYKKAEKILNEKTEGGTKNTCYDDIDYYRMFPADTVMLYSYEKKHAKKI